MGANSIGPSSPSTPPQRPSKPTAPQKNEISSPAPKLSKEESKTSDTSIFSRKSSTAKTPRFLRSDSADSGISSGDEMETSFTILEKTTEQKTAIARQKKLVNSLQSNIKKLQEKPNQTRSDWKKLQPQLEQIKQQTDLAGSPNQTRHGSIKLYTSLRQALETQSMPLEGDQANETGNEILNLSRQTALMAAHQMPEEIVQTASAGLSSSQATDNIASWMIFYNEAKDNLGLFEDQASQENFCQLCKNIALDRMTYPNQKFDLPPPIEKEVTKGREATEKEIDKELKEMRTAFAEHQSISFPKQSRKDILRIPVSLIREGENIYDTKPALRGMETLSKLGKVTAEHREQISRAQEAQVTNFLLGLDPEQQMQIISRLSQIEQLDMADNLSKSLTATLPEWGYPSPDAQNKTVTVHRNGDTVTVTHSLEAIVTFMNPFDSAISTLQFLEGPPAILSRTITFKPGEAPEIGPLSMNVELIEATA